MVEQRRIHDVFQTSHVVNLDRYRKHRLSLGILGSIPADDPVGLEGQVGCLRKEFQIIQRLQISPVNDGRTLRLNAYADP